MKNFRGTPCTPAKIKDKLLINKQPHAGKAWKRNQGGFNHGSTAQFTSNEL
jgi:hypothetical protein